jgi:FixJ family two-component response regulator
MITENVKSSCQEIAVVDDDAGVRKAVGRLLAGAGYNVFLFRSAEEFLAHSVRPNCVIVDVELPGLSGIELEQKLRESSPHTPVVFFTGCGDTKRASIAKQTGRICIHKPADERVLLEAVIHAIQREL